MHQITPNSHLLSVIKLKNMKLQKEKKKNSNSSPKNLIDDNKKTMNPNSSTPIINHKIENMKL